MVMCGGVGEPDDAASLPAPPLPPMPMFTPLSPLMLPDTAKPPSPPPPPMLCARMPYDFSAVRGDAGAAARAP